jgi:hypothetical protein
LHNDLIPSSFEIEVVDSPATTSPQPTTPSIPIQNSHHTKATYIVVTLPLVKMGYQSQLALILQTFDQTGAAGTMRPNATRDEILNKALPVYLLQARGQYPITSEEYHQYRQELWTEALRIFAIHEYNRYIDQNLYLFMKFKGFTDTSGVSRN